MDKRVKELINCRQCGQPYLSSTRAGQCLQCNRRAKAIRALYGELRAKQGPSCGICKTPELRNKKLSVDHCHKTGKIRGLLCDRCNQGLGLARDNPETLLAAAAYIRKHTAAENTTDTQAA